MNSPADIPAATWSSLATPDAARRESWKKAGDPTRWAPCGWQWDAVAITPLAVGLEALDRMRLSRRRGYPVLADHIRGVLYVLVAPGSCAGIDLPGVSVLSSGHQILMPCTDYGTASADWLSHPLEVPPPLVRATHLVKELQRLTVGWSA